MQYRIDFLAQQDLPTPYIEIQTEVAKKKSAEMLGSLICKDMEWKCVARDNEIKWQLDVQVFPHNEWLKFKSGLREILRKLDCPSYLIAEVGELLDYIDSLNEDKQNKDA